MTINQNASEFYGMAVQDFDPARGLSDPAGIATRLRLTWDDAETFEDRFTQFLDTPGAQDLTALVIGFWADSGSSSDTIVEALVSTRGRLPNLKALFVGDIIYEENEISWIIQTDMSPIWTAFPNIEVFRVRGGQNLSLGRIVHPRLKSLTVETGGLPSRVAREVGRADTPELEHLELWLGSRNYGGTTVVEDLAPILSGERFPKLRRLGLCDCDWGDGLAAALADAPVLERIDALDLSLGTVGDAGARALAASPGFKRLKTFRLHHHYVSDEGLAALAATGVRIDAADRQKQDDEDDDESRYVAVSE